MRTTPHTREPDGELLANSNVVACDALAYLSGVNYGSVVKVIAAMHAIAAYTELNVEDVAGRFESVPTQSPQPGNPEHKMRLRETDRFVRAVIKQGFALPYEDLLRTRVRFPAQAEQAQQLLTP